MGLIAFLGGVLYGLLHYFWLKNINMTGMEDACEDTGMYMDVPGFSLLLILHVHGRFQKKLVK